MQAHAILADQHASHLPASYGDLVGDLQLIGALSLLMTSLFCCILKGTPEEVVSCLH